MQIFVAVFILLFVLVLTALGEFWDQLPNEFQELVMGVDAKTWDPTKPIYQISDKGF